MRQGSQSCQPKRCCLHAQLTCRQALVEFKHSGDADYAWRKLDGTQMDGRCAPHEYMGARVHRLLSTLGARSCLGLPPPLHTRTFHLITHLASHITHRSWRLEYATPSDFRNFGWTWDEGSPTRAGGGSGGGGGGYNSHGARASGRADSALIGSGNYNNNTYPREGKGASGYQRYGTPSPARQGYGSVGH